MTYKAAARNLHFMSQEGSSSVRISQRGYGGESMRGDPIAILPTLKEQLDTINKRVKALPALIQGASSFEEAERLRKELAAKTAQFFRMRKIVHQGCMLALEHIFLNVAKARLPEELFQSMISEAWDCWKSEGFAELMPEPNKQELRRSSRKLAYREWKAGK